MQLPSEAVNEIPVPDMHTHTHTPHQKMHWSEKSCITYVPDDLSDIFQV